MSEEMRQIYNTHGINSYMKPISTLRQQLVNPNDQTPHKCQSCVIYQIICDQNPAHQYIDESKHTLATRFRKQQTLDDPAAVSDHITSIGNTVILNNTKIVAKEEQWYARRVKEAVYMQTHVPFLNRDQSLLLLAVYDRSLLLELSGAINRHSRDQGHGPKHSTTNKKFLSK